MNERLPCLIQGKAISVVHVGMELNLYCFLDDLVRASGFIGWDRPRITVESSFNVLEVPFQLSKINNISVKIPPFVFPCLLLIKQAPHHKDQGGIAALILNSSIPALDVEQSASHSSCFTPRERTPGIHWIAGWVSPRAGLDVLTKRNPTPGGNQTSDIQPIANHYTN
jgi:hypothetical protein